MAAVSVTVNREIIVRGGFVMMTFDNLFKPGKIGKLEIKNRFAIPSMIVNLGDDEGNITERTLKYYEKRAKGGFGLIMTEAVAIDERGRATNHELGLWKDEQIDGFRKLAEVIHAGGAKMIVQLHHAGRQTVPALIYGKEPEAPSRVACPLNNYPPEKMSIERIHEVVKEFGDAALRAKKAGADGVEVHGSHGYLIAQFMSQHSNRRTDEYGGDFYGRMRFAKEIFEDVRSKVGDDFTMTFRMADDEKVPDGRTLEESIVVAQYVEQFGVDAIHVSMCCYGSLNWMSPNASAPYGYNQFQTNILKSTVSIPIISVGRYTPAVAESALKNGYADFIAFGRESIAEPELPNKLAAGSTDDIIPCISCTQSCIGYILKGDYASCLINPMTGHEIDYDLTRVAKPKKVGVIGGGPAGLVAAIWAARRGHDVTLLEKNDEPGGQFRLAAVPPCKQDIANAIKYYIHTAGKEGVDIRTNCEVTEDFLKGAKFDAIVLATGGKPACPPIPGLKESEIAMNCIDILDNTVVPGNRVLILGGGMTGVETADYLAEHGRKVTIVEMLEDIALDEAVTPRIFLMERLKEREVEKVVNAKVKQVLNDGVVIETPDGIRELHGFDSIGLALGVKKNDSLLAAAKAACGEVHVIGDAETPGPANHATEAGLRAAFKL